MSHFNQQKHIFFKGYSESLAYKYPKNLNPPKVELKTRDRSSHGQNIRQLLDNVKADFLKQKHSASQINSMNHDDCIYVEFVSEWGFQLKLESLDQDNNKPKYQLVNIREEQRNIGNDKTEYRYFVTLMMYEGGISQFIRKVEDYLNKNIIYKGQDTGNPKNYSLINNIQSIQTATLKAFWTDSPEIPFPEEDVVVWWEVWFRKTQEDEEKLSKVFQNLDQLGVEIGKSEINFAEHRVRLIKGSAKQLSQSLLLLDNLSELRRPQETAEFITYKEDNKEHKEWLDDLLQRTDNIIDEDCVLICLLDSGVNNYHPLLLPFLSEEHLYSYKKDAWGMYDSVSGGGHGTPMAALALYGDLVDALASPHKIRITHGLESFKIIHFKDPNNPELYAAITEEGCSTPFIDRPKNKRVFCLSVTSSNGAFKGRPSAWSASIDKIAFGSALDPIDPQLFLCSSGNVQIDRKEDYLAKNDLESIHDPSQAYNCITVGGYTRKDRIESENYLPLANNGGMAPCNSTSLLWEHQWPIKPEIVLEAGNLSTDGVSTYDHPSLRLLSADSEYPNYVFRPFGDTSAAVALAAKLAAELRTEYPDFWPETIRALMIHSADWTSEMLGYKKIKDLNEAERKCLLRTVGYGVPDKTKAIFSTNNSLTLVTEKHIQPYIIEEGVSKYNEYHLFQLPWPVDILQDELYDQDVTLKLTLSYFIEPNPGSRNKRYSNNFHYHSHSLDFTVIKPNESLSVFKRRVSAAVDLPEDEIDGKDEPWFIKRVRSRGSVKKDFITMSGAEMAKRNVIAIFPKSGWYKTRKKLGKISDKVRYSLIVTVETPVVNADIFTPVFEMISNVIPNKV